MSLPELPKPDETWSASALAAHQVMSAQIEKLMSTVDELQRQLKLNSRTSSKPPSSDRERRPAKKKKKTGRTKGAQKGHKGSTRVLLEPDEVINCEPIDAHCSCGGSWVERESFKRLQITDLPQIKPTVTEYRERCLSCERCGHETYASARLPLGESRFGPYLHTFIVSLNLESRLSFRQIRALLKQSFNLSVSVGAISDMVKRVARHSKSSFEELLTWYQQDKGAKHVDETGWKVRGERTQLISTLNDSAVLYQCSKLRKAEDVKRLIGHDLKQLIICDRAFVYHPWELRQLCWAHTLRDFNCFDTYREMKSHAKALIKYTQRLFELARGHQSGRISTADYVLRASEIRPLIKSILKSLSELEVAKKPDGTVRNLLKYEEQLWTFLKYPAIPIHNNRQESALRPLVIKRKLSFGNDTPQGADRLAQLMSIIETLKRQGRDVYSWFINAFQGETSSLVPTPLASR